MLPLIFYRFVLPDNKSVDFFQILPLASLSVGSGKTPVAVGKIQTH
jgi:hypothetical protein